MDKICDLTDTIVDVRFGDSDLDTYKYEPMDNLLDCREKENRDKRVKHCHEQRRHFSPFFLSVDGMLGKEDLVILSNLS